jgi:predicted lipoprotein with Yx(FWY)xxD motif
MRRVLIVFALAGVIAAACGGGAAVTPTPAAAAAGTVKLAASSLGQILVDAGGRTLYGFRPDEATGAPTCTGSCAGTWPALMDPGNASVGAGLDASKLTIVARPDAGNQVKYGTHPLYYFANDAAAGDTKGQGIGGNWFVVGADGNLIQP